MSDTLEDLGVDFQLDLMKLMTEGMNFMLSARKYIKPEFFSNSRMQFLTRHMYDFHEKYRMLPDKTFLKSVCRDEKDRVILKRMFRARTIREEFIRDKTQQFVKRSMFIEFFETSGTIYNRGEQDKAYDLMTNGMEQLNQVSLNDDVYRFLLKDFERRMLEREQANNTLRNYRIPTGLIGLDRALKGGIGNGELGFWLGDAKSGKSYSLIQCATNAVRRFETTLAIHLEGTEQQNLDRYDACFSGALYDEVKANEFPPQIVRKMLKIAKRRQYKDLIIKHYNEWDACSVLDVERDYLSMLAKGYNIKLIVIDYFDLMKARRQFRDSEESARQKSISRDLKTLAVKYNVPIWTATQTNRYIDNEDPNFIITSKNASEDYNKIRALDILVTINATTEEREKGYARVFLDSYRDSKARRLFRIKQDLDRSRFYKRA